MDQLKWKAVGARVSISPLEFTSNGGVKIGSTLYDKSCEFDGCRLGGAKFDFKNGNARIENEVAIVHLEFLGELGWRYALVHKGANAQAGAVGTRWLFGVAFLTAGILFWWFYG